MPPLWALGNQQSRWGYMNAGGSTRHRPRVPRRDIPCDALYLDIDYMDGYRVFTWDDDVSPTPTRLIADLAEQGFRVVTIVDPGVKVDEGYSVYPRAGSADLYCKTSAGRSTTTSSGPAYAPSPTSRTPQTREWWGEPDASCSMRAWPGSGAT